MTTNSHPNPDRLLKPAEAAALFHVAAKTLYRWGSEGKLSYVRTLGGQRRYLEAEVMALREGRPT
jgi:excisionase family DNA binding protein